MLGIARAGQQAGWGDVPARFKALVTAITRAYGKNTGYASARSWTINSPANSTYTPAFDGTGLTDEYGSVVITTLKYQEASNYTWADVEFIPGYQEPMANTGNNTLYVTAINMGTQNDGTGNSKIDYQLIRFIKHNATNQVGFLINYSTYTDIRFNRTWDSLADRWLTVVICYGSAGDFTNFVHDTATYGNATTVNAKQCRAYLYDAKTGELLSKTDKTFNAFTSIITDRSSKTWNFRNANDAPATSYNVWASFMSPDPGGYDTKVNVNAVWSTFGQPFDPAVVGLDCVGNVFPEYIGGKRAWFNATIDSVGSGLAYGLGPGRCSMPSPNQTLLGTCASAATVSSDTP